MKRIARDNYVNSGSRVQFTMPYGVMLFRNPQRKKQSSGFYLVSQDPIARGSWQVEPSAAHKPMSCPPSLHVSWLLLPHQQTCQHARTAKSRQGLHFLVVAAREHAAGQALHVRRQQIDGLGGLQHAVELGRGKELLRLGLDFIVQHVGADRQAYASAENAGLGQSADEDGCRNIQSAFTNRNVEWRPKAEEQK